MPIRPPNNVSIGNFDTLATYAHALLDGLVDDEAKPTGMVAAISAKARLGCTSWTQEDDFRMRSSHSFFENPKSNGSVWWAPFSFKWLSRGTHEAETGR
jgi:hypothetical protein